jgi:hypothetical protein
MILFVYFYNKCYFKPVCTKYSKTNTQERLCTTYINPLEHTAGCETVETSMSFACNSSFLSVDGMTCISSFIKQLMQSIDKVVDVKICVV